MKKVRSQFTQLLMLHEVRSVKTCRRSDKTPRDETPKSARVLKVMTALASLLSQDQTFAEAANNAVLEPWAAAHLALMQQAASREELSAHADIATLSQVLPSMAAYRSRVQRRALDVTSAYCSPSRVRSIAGRPHTDTHRPGQSLTHARSRWFCPRSRWRLARFMLVSASDCARCIRFCARQQPIRASSTREQASAHCFGLTINAIGPKAPKPGRTPSTPGR
jgi:hypothetical protein